MGRQCTCHHEGVCQWCGNGSIRCGWTQSSLDSRHMYDTSSLSALSSLGGGPTLCVGPGSVAGTVVGPGELVPPELLKQTNLLPPDSESDLCNFKLIGPGNGGKTVMGPPSLPGVLAAARREQGHGSWTRPHWQFNLNGAIADAGRDLSAYPPAPSRDYDGLQCSADSNCQFQSQPETDDRRTEDEIRVTPAW